MAGIRFEHSHSYWLLFQLRKNECSKSFESERFTMTVAWVVNRGEMFKMWVLVNGSQISLVGQRPEKPEANSKFHLYVHFCLF